MRRRRAAGADAQGRGLTMRRWAILVAVLLLAALVVLCGLVLLLSEDPMEATRRRVPLGADEAAVIAAVGRPPRDRLNYSDPSGVLAAVSS